MSVPVPASKSSFQHLLDVTGKPLPSMLTISCYHWPPAFIHSKRSVLFSLDIKSNLLSVHLIYTPTNTHIYYLKF